MLPQIEKKAQVVALEREATMVKKRVFTSFDFDHDEDVDLFDYGALQSCFTDADDGLTPYCESGDLNEDDRLNLTDFAVLQSALTGP